MVALTFLDQERVREHIGYNVPRGIPAALESRLQDAFNSIRSDYAIEQIKKWLDRCDAILEASNPMSGEAYTQKQLILGDINRATTNIGNREINYWWELYLKQTDQLAFKLNVPNLRRPENAGFLWVRWGADYVQGLPGPPDSCTSDRIYLSRNMV
ncbi:MAG TPA: hypothetical protein V6C58_07950 [Allocoleopsis sp.]